MIPKMSRIGLSVSALLLVANVLAAKDAKAGIVYNINDNGAFPGASGSLPGTWIGGNAPAYAGTLNAVWYADLTAGSVDTVSSAGGIAAGASSTYQLAVGPFGWLRTTTNNAVAHGADVGLIHLETAADLIITVSADSPTPANPSTVIRPGFSLFEGWDTSTSASPATPSGSYVNNQNNPLNTVGLTYLNGGGAAAGDSSVSLLFANLAAGDYTLILGGIGSSSSDPHGAYSVTFDVDPVPLPGAIWLMGSALLGLIGMRTVRRV